MNAEQAIMYVASLSMLFVNKVITRDEFRKALSVTPLYTHVCDGMKSKKVTKK